MSQERKPNPTAQRDNPDRAKNAILGALVADAAALGLHWIYDQDRVREVAGNTPEFREPDASACCSKAAPFRSPGVTPMLNAPGGMRTIRMPDRRQTTCLGSMYLTE